MTQFYLVDADDNPIGLITEDVSEHYGPGPSIVNAWVKEGDKEALVAFDRFGPVEASVVYYAESGCTGVPYWPGMDEGDFGIHAVIDGKVYSFSSENVDRTKVMITRTQKGRCIGLHNKHGGPFVVGELLFELPEYKAPFKIKAQ